MYEKKACVSNLDRPFDGFSLAYAFSRGAQALCKISLMVYDGEQEE